MTERTLGIDVSSWQDLNSTTQKIDWGKAASQGAKFVFVKASQDSFTDEDFAYNWVEAKKAGILRGAYHFFDYRHSALNQAKYFAGLLKDDPGELPPVLDIEYREGWGAMKRDNILKAIQIFFEAMQSEGFPRLIFYSNPNTVLYTLKPIPTWLTTLPLWIAHYGVKEPMVSAWEPWGDWTFWQYTATGDGLAFGMESKGLDMNWFNGSEEELKAFANIPSGPEIEPEKPWARFTEAERLEKLCEAHPEIWK